MLKRPKQWILLALTVTGLSLAQAKAGVAPGALPGGMLPPLKKAKQKRNRSGWEGKIRALVPGAWVFPVGNPSYVDFIDPDESSAWRATFSPGGQLLGVTRVSSHLSDAEADVFPVSRDATRLARVKLPGMLENGTLASLQLTVVNALGLQAVASNLLFHYDTEDQRFDDVQAYYFADRAMRWFKDQASLELKDPLEIKTHVGTGGKGNAAFYFQHKVFLGTGDGVLYRNLMRDPSVVVHEVSHAYIDELAALPSQGEGGALNEGMADFFAAAMLDNPRIGEASYLQGKYRRTLENTKRAFRDFVAGVYENGTVVGGTLWDIRKALGRETAILLATKVLTHLNQNAGFHDFAPALLKAASEARLKPGEPEKIQEILRGRGWVSS